MPHSFNTGVVLYGVLSAFLSLFVNYCLGKPGSENFSPHEIFSWYSAWLAEWRLMRTDRKKYTEWIDGSDASTKDLWRMIYQEAEEKFTWERAVGMCVICTGFWISLICGFFYTLDPVQIVEIVLIAHIFIRLLSKIL